MNERFRNAQLEALYAMGAPRPVVQASQTPQVQPLLFSPSVNPNSLIPSRYMYQNSNQNSYGDSLAPMQMYQQFKKSGVMPDMSYNQGQVGQIPTAPMTSSLGTQLASGSTGSGGK